MARGTGVTQLGQDLIAAATEAREIAKEGKLYWSSLEFFKTQYPAIKNFLREEREKGKSILPDKLNVFNAFLLTPRDKVKVVILGQDPYPNKEHAMGLAFSVPARTYPLPPSLQNICEELFNDLGNEHTNLSNGSLVPWAKQGVLLLNTSLTVEEGKSNSHAYIGWKELIKEVLESVSTEQDGIVFILWGGNAHSYKEYIKNPEKHMILQSSHPSPLSANRGFFGSKPFSKTNFFLESVGKSPINW